MRSTPLPISIQGRARRRERRREIDTDADAMRFCPYRANRHIQPNPHSHKLDVEQPEYHPASCLTCSMPSIPSAISIQGRARRRERRRKIDADAMRSCPYRASRPCQTNHLLHKFDLEQPEYHPASCLTCSMPSTLLPISVQARARKRGRRRKIDTVVSATQSSRSRANRHIQPSHPLHKFHLDKPEYHPASCLTCSMPTTLLATSIQARARKRGRRRKIDTVVSAAQSSRSSQSRIPDQPSFA